MRPADLCSLCAQNLKRRKARTLLTALGVLVGCCSILIMVSIGFGLQEQTERTLEKMGDLTVITVSASSASEQGGTKLDANAVEQIRSIDGVVAASPKFSADGLQLRISANNGRYVNEWTSLVGMDAESLDGVGYTATSGRQINTEAASGSAGSGIEVLVGQYFAYGFTDTFRPEGMNYVDRYEGMVYDDEGVLDEEASTVPDPFFDPLKVGPATLEVSNYEGDVVGTFTINIVGVLAEDYSRGYETGDGIVMDDDDLMAILKQAQGTSFKQPSYESVLVKVKSISDVESCESAIKAMGFTTYSMESIRKPMEESAQQQQLMLGGLGAISLLVAAIGITNTMVMSITERTREIGVMKALGCYVRDIKALFLAEAGSIGLLGGLAACVTSFVASLVMNLVNSGNVSMEGVAQAIFGGEIARMSVIPVWLYGFAIAFSVLVGLVSGFYPACKAVRVPAIEAIKSE